MSQAHNFNIVRMFHPTQYTPSLDESGQFFQRFFGRPSSLAETVLKKIVPPDSGYPTDYCAFTSIRDVFFDSLVPEKFIPGGVQVYPSVKSPTLKTVGWYTEGLEDLYGKLTGSGFTITNAAGDPMKEFQSKFPVPGGKPMFFTKAYETGLKYQFFEEGTFFFDARSEPGWVLPPVEENCPFGLEFCSHHTVLTDNPERALRLLVDMLGGTVIDRGRNEALQANSTFVALADGVFELATPDQGTPASDAHAALAPDDTYYTLTWKVGDLDRVERHLAAIGAGVMARTQDTLIVDPADGNGIPWGFTTALRDNDPRSSGQS
ncbi:MAG: VOC family protein [Novosphingobium sp.]